MTDINELAVITTSLLAIALGSIWYSPLVFGSYWQKVVGLTDADLALSKTELVRSLIVAFASNSVVFFVIAHLIRASATFGMSRSELATTLSALIVAALTSMAVWEQRSLAYVLIHAGYATLMIAIGVGVIAYWPW
jgi:hypothetical protein